MKEKIIKWDEIDRLWGKCQDCEKEYLDFQDLMIPDELWEKINPTVYKGAGILCPNCILNRLREIGVVKFAFGMENLRIEG